MSIIDPNIKNSLEQLYTSGTLNDFKSLYIYENRVNIPLSKNINRLQKEQLYDYLKTQYRDDEFFTLTEIDENPNGRKAVYRVGVDKLPRELDTATEVVEVKLVGSQEV